MSEKEVSCMIRRVILSPVAGLLLVITAILGVGYSSAHAQTQTRHLVFSTYLGPKTPPYRPCAYLRPELRQRRPGEYLRDRRHHGLRSSRPPNAYQPSPAPDSTQSAFVAKYDPNGQPLWCTYLGGDNQSMGIGVAAMPNGGVVVVGLTTSDNFPTMNAYQGQNNATTGIRITS